MSTQNLSSAALHVVGQYNEAGKTLVNVYRTGAHRLLGSAASRYGSLFGERELPMVSEELKSRLLGAHEKVNGFLTKRVDIDTGRVIALMDRFAETATRGIESVAKAAARVEAPVTTSVINVFTRVHQPIATASVKIADTVASGAKKIESRVAGTAEADAQEEPSAKAKPATRRRTGSRSRALKA
ncbi:MAG: hypothetical protein J7605_14770 [Variovorax sp.]|nr:hypothetical protein [Variovorax sp.]